MESLFDEPRLKKRIAKAKETKLENNKTIQQETFITIKTNPTTLQSEEVKLNSIKTKSNIESKRKLSNQIEQTSKKKKKIQINNSIIQSTPFSVIHSLETNLPTGKLTSSSKLIHLNRNSYKIWFDSIPNSKQDQDKSKSTNQDPFVRVLYPSGRHETFPLLIPKSDEGEYRPLDDLLNVMTTTLSYYLTPDQSNFYFSEPHPIPPFYNSREFNSTDFQFLSEQKSDSTLSAEPSSSSSQQLNENSSKSITTPLPQIPVSNPSLDLSSKPLLKSLTRSIKKKIASDFFQLVGWYNRVIKFLVQNDLIKKEQQLIHGGLPKGIWEIILRQSYDRKISTNLNVLQNYETWSSNVYGELRPGFIDSILNELIDLQPNQVFVDLGSGIGNIVLQVALQIGCVSVGFEIMDGYSDLATQQRDEVIGRADKLWNAKLGLPVLLHADFTKDPQVGKWLQQADVVLVNNQVFTPTLNESLTLLFLELKDSAKIISLKPFIPTSFKINQRNLDSPLSILTKPEPNQLKNYDNSKQIKNPVFTSSAPGIFNYPSNSVSWTNNPGKFFITVVDRSRLIQFQNDQLSSS